MLNIRKKYQSSKHQLTVAVELVKTMIPNDKTVYLSLMILINGVKIFWCLQADKASMLDEIIDYVKFLQLQVKVRL